MKQAFNIAIRLFLLLQVILLIVQLSSCQKDIPLVAVTNYPNQINTIISTQCATTGCHNTASKQGAGGLDLSSWTAMFQGGAGGSVVIPYRADRSWLCFYTNTYPDLGISLAPIMPVNGSPISHSEEVLIQNWINNGAPDANGKVAFCCDQQRDKFYVSNQGCDEVTVFDTKTRLAMRYISVGVTQAIESPHCLRVSPDGKYWYVVFAVGGGVVQKFDAGTDQLIGNIALPDTGSWNDLIISANGRYGLISNWKDNGQVELLDLQKMTVLKDFTQIQFPHGLAALPDFSKVYYTGYTNTISYLEFDTTTFELLNSDFLSLLQPTEMSGKVLTPHDLILTPDNKYLLVTDQDLSTNDVRIIDVATNKLFKVIPVGIFPQEFALSKKYPYVFVTCSGTTANGATKTEGEVDVINYKTWETVKVLTAEVFQPHGVAVDDKNNIVVISSRNIDIDGPQPHHISDCGGRNGFINLVDLNTLNFIGNSRTEVSVDPYFTTVRNQ